MMAHGTHVV